MAVPNWESYKDLDLWLSGSFFDLIEYTVQDYVELQCRRNGGHMARVLSNQLTKDTSYCHN